jgi:hypothetical protein
MNWKGHERKRSWPNLRYVPAFAWRAEENTKNISQNNRPPSGDLNPGPTEYETGVLTTRP